MRGGRHSQHRHAINAKERGLWNGTVRCVFALYTTASKSGQNTFTIGRRHFFDVMASVKESSVWGPVACARGSAVHIVTRISQSLYMAPRQLKLRHYRFCCHSRTS